MSGRHAAGHELEADLSGLPLDEPMPEDRIPKVSNFHQGYFAEIARMIREDKPTAAPAPVHALRAWQQDDSRVSALKTVADMRIEEWFVTGACDAFMTILNLMPAGLADFVAQVVPILQQRRLFRREYQGRTLREHLDLARPANRHAGGERRAAE